MSSLTIQPDKDTDVLLSQLSKLLQQRKPTLAHVGIVRYWKISRHSKNWQR